MRSLSGVYGDIRGGGTYCRGGVGDVVVAGGDGGGPRAK